jgi:type IV pilus assembly protein PilY1
VYFVDATPVVGDIQIGGVWKTILVGGLNAGGSGYYALDITDPLSPKMLWEFTNSNMGLSFGNPVITKRKDGTWIVAVTSGYNNTDGLGHLFILNANTGALLKTIDTTAGSGGTPSGLAKLNAWVNDEVDNTAERFYAADLLGNVWRIDIDDVLAPKSAAFKLAQVIKDGVPQPITTTPQLAEIESAGKTYVVVYVGTGRYLGKTDVSDASVQSIYAIKDALGTVSLEDVRGGGTLVQQELTTSGSVRTVSKSTAVDWTTQNGWFIDLLSAGERINVNMQLAFNVLVAAGNVPGTTATDCSSAGAGTSWLYQLDIANGLPPTTSAGSSKKAIGAKMPSMVAGMTPITLKSAGAGSGQIEVTLTSGGVKNVGVDMASASASKPRRSSWRELID